MNKKMMREENYRDNKIYLGDKDELFQLVAEHYDLGDFIKHTKVEIGYEDDNNALETSKGKYFVKIFGAYRSLGECLRYLDVLAKILAAGVSTPKILDVDGNLLYQIGETRLAVFEYIDGKSFYELDRSPSKDEARLILSEAAKINKVNYKPSFVYDEWAIVNILDQYKISEPFLSPSEKDRIKPLVEEYKKIYLNSLPHGLVHGDIIATNVIKGVDGRVNIVDFACSNYAPRIVELAVLVSNLLIGFPPKFIIAEYEKNNPLSDQEIDLLPFFVDLAHAMHVIGAVRERDIHGNKSDENKYWLNEGLRGLKI